MPITAEIIRIKDHNDDHKVGGLDFLSPWLTLPSIAFRYEASPCTLNRHQGKFHHPLILTRDGHLSRFCAEGLGIHAGDG